MHGEYITDIAWVKMFKFFESHPNIYVIHEAELRLFVEAIFWIVKTGAQWRMLPEKYGKWNSVFKRFRDWSKKNIWRDLMNFCISEPDLEYVAIDTTVERAHASSAGYGEQEEQGLGRSCGGFSTKVHAVVDALGNPLKLEITPGQASDLSLAKYMLASIAGAFVLGDKGYDSDDLRETIKSQGCIPVIPGRSNRIIPVEYDKHIYKERCLVECFFSKMKYFRRVFVRYDKSKSSFLAFLFFVGAIIWLR